MHPKNVPPSQQAYVVSLEFVQDLPFYTRLSTGVSHCPPFQCCLKVQLIFYIRAYIKTIFQFLMALADINPEVTVVFKLELVNLTLTEAVCRLYKLITKLIERCRCQQNNPRLPKKATH